MSFACTRGTGNGTAGVTGQLPSGAPARLICLGASTGGPQALRKICAALGPDDPVAVLIAQHMPRSFTPAFAARLDRLSQVPVAEAAPSSQVRAGRVYIAAGGSHLTLALAGEQLVCRVDPAAPGDHYVPSVDRLFSSCAALFGPRLLAAVLTGMGSDGRDGAIAVHGAGGRVLAESRESAAIFGMPEAAWRTGSVEALLPLPALIARLQAFARDG